MSSGTGTTITNPPTWICGECHQVIAEGMLHSCQKAKFIVFNTETFLTIPDPSTLLWVADWIENKITHEGKFVIAKLLREMVKE